MGQEIIAVVGLGYDPAGNVPAEDLRAANHLIFSCDPSHLAKAEPDGVFVDVKSAHDAGAITAAGYQLWRL